MTLEQKQTHTDRGDCWLWAALDADSKVIVSWRTGKRSSDAAHAFAYDLASRVNGRVQITSDKLNAYNYCLPGAFGERMDYAQEEKQFLQGPSQAGEVMKRRVTPLVGVKREAIMGNPNLRTSTVCHVERFFLTMRQGNKRCARKTLAYSKLWDNHALTASLHIFVYNMVRKHEALKGKTPAQALGVVGERWTLEDVVAMTEAYLNAKEEAEFEKAFADFNVRPLAKRTFQPTPKAELLTPWYLDPQSGGPNPPTEERKSGVRYED
jgi:IS1 family transposase